ncbi:hypothetical protein GCM10017688_47870 [Streptomyces ramulosus]
MNRPLAVVVSVEPSNFAEFLAAVASLAAFRASIGLWAALSPPAASPPPPPLDAFEPSLQALRPPTSRTTPATAAVIRVLRI